MFSRLIIKDIDLSRAVSAARWVRKWEALLASSLP